MDFAQFEVILVFFGPIIYAISMGPRRCPLYTHLEEQPLSLGDRIESF